MNERCLGILREVQNSPNRESDDALILEAVLFQLSLLGIKTEKIAPEEADRRDLSSYDLIIPMCEVYPRIKRLGEIAKDSAALWANPPQSVLNCYRLKMLELLAKRPDILFPRSEVRRVEDALGQAPFPSESGYWLKRGDVHNTCDHDVVFAETWAQARPILSDFASREITHCVIQPHIEGDVVKFYGAGPGRWFTWFHHDTTRAKRHPFSVDELARLASQGARALDLGIFGGDAIISPDGTVTLLDLNSWPSFARVRQEAAVQIAWHLQARLKSPHGQNGKTPSRTIASTRRNP
ncbi:MAG: hypothetical protein WCU88_07360 [Elusimicrobiota bacterium]|jgi:hypothetical protein